MVKRIAVSIACLTIIGCGGAPGGSIAGDGSESPQITRTIVRRSPDGTSKVTVETITRATQVAEIDARAAFVARLSQPDHAGVTADLLIAEDSGCALASMWLFDQENLAGNEICFMGLPGQGPPDNQGAGVDLAQYSRWECTASWICFDVSWNASVRSFWAGVDQGLIEFWFGNVPSTGPCDIFFKAWQREDSVSPRMQASEYLVFVPDDTSACFQ